MNQILSELINEAIHWEKQLNESERSEISYSEAKERVKARIYTKYEKLLFTSFVDPEIISLFKQIKNIQL
jgi:hypothetical protein